MRARARGALRRARRFATLPVVIALLALVVAQAASAQVGLGAARPAECGLLQGFRGANVWERAKEPQLRRYCDLLASGTSKLVGKASLAKEVVDIAEEAEKLMPGRAAPRVLAGRAHLRIGNASDALSALADARARDDRALDDPAALLAWARANARTGHVEEATRAYRAALPRTSALSAQDRSAASFEAGMIVMAKGLENVDDAIAMLRQARREAQDAMQVAAVVALALALDRAGQHDEARAVLAERVRGDVATMLSDTRVTDSLTDAGVATERQALIAIALEPTDPPEARAAWRKFLDATGSRGPYGEHARAREAALGGAPKGRNR